LFQDTENLDFEKVLNHRHSTIEGSEIATIFLYLKFCFQRNPTVHFRRSVYSWLLSRYRGQFADRVHGNRVWRQSLRAANGNGILA